MKRTARAIRKIHNGIALIGGDAHFWPGKVPTAWRAFEEFAKELSPELIILNGDVIDGASISRHPRIGWEKQPSVAEEIEFAQERLEKLERLATDSELIWNLGNHDARFEMRIASVASELEGVHGIHLRDHFQAWTPAWSVQINKDTIIKHRFKGGTHAAFNNAKDSGFNIVTGHLHALNAVAYTDYRGTRWGVDAGMLADPMGPQFSNYTEDNPLNWRSGFVVLRYVNGVLQMPELLYVINEKKGQVNYNGDTFHV